MFQMMNEARIAVGRGAVSIACAAYHASLAYAKERTQGRKLTASGAKNSADEPVQIIQHPDVRRMLLFQKAMYEGSLSLILQAAYYHDKMMQSHGESKEKYHLLLEILTPVAKTYPSEKGIESVSNGVQILGGYGFCSEYILQQYYRDIRISAIYEGTTGIQSLDLLGRKIVMNDGKAYQLLKEELAQTIHQSKAITSISEQANLLETKIKMVDDVIAYLVQKAQKKDYESFLANATVFMEMFANMIIGWQWLKIANAATAQDAFENSKVQTMKFYFVHELPKIDSLATTLLTDKGITIPDKTEIEF